MIAPEIPTKTVERLSRYRRIVRERSDGGAISLFSYELAKLAGGSAAQVRRDLMAIGCSGSPIYGYKIDTLVEAIGLAIDGATEQRMVLVGLGHLGAALVDFVERYCPKLVIFAAFDIDPSKIGRVHHGVRVYSVESIGQIVAEQQIRIAILAVPGEAAQAVADGLVAAGVHGILNFAPSVIRTPINVYVEQTEITATLEKVAYFARHYGAQQKQRKER
ncbi:MAG: redox-sensing transcriptional repressor Rex [Deltaproteobacteria bacterium]|nr:redox-sensing transcriptional repressor Rex [Deltaproteobacteria bacterium]